MIKRRFLIIKSRVFGYYLIAAGWCESCNKKSQLLSAGLLVFIGGTITPSQFSLFLLSLRWLPLQNKYRCLGSINPIALRGR
jgi:hypothetical protein